jgi:hypothetical protein
MLLRWAGSEVVSIHCKGISFKSFCSEGWVCDGNLSPSTSSSLSSSSTSSSSFSCSFSLPLLLLVLCVTDFSKEWYAYGTIIYSNF